MMLLFLRYTRFCLTLTACFIGSTLATGLFADSEPPATSVSNSWNNLPADKLKEYQDGLAARTKWLGKLPEGSVSVLDLPYEEHSIQGTLPASNQTLDLYVPKGSGPFPLIVWIHGGAWKAGLKETEGAQLAAMWLPEGLAVASIDYRFVFDAPFPGMFQDGVDAVAFLRSHADQYHLDSQKIGIMGISAGAHLAGLVAMTEGTSTYAHSGPPVQAAVLLCGFYDMTAKTGQWPPGAFPINPLDDFSRLYPNRTYDPVIAQKMSPLYQIHAGVPPVLLIHGDKDSIAPALQSTMFLEALQKAGIAVTLTNYPNDTHNLWKSDVLAEALGFFKSIFLEK